MPVGAFDIRVRLGLGASRVSGGGRLAQRVAEIEDLVRRADAVTLDAILLPTVFDTGHWRPGEEQACDVRN